ncbi:glycosyltransferase [Thioclava atlantica]|uniref:Glycosyl transferase family protein n=1 Tax=Thioclava atlantica TaxID=1317124 RepID=A0A085TWN9_9RHOB|nr:glycosyltransferase [Thioclava atlantica]KFE35136.1 glycosyl transferase family protein [Thioclava atlantica]
MARVTILMAICRPGPELAEQLASLAAQTHRDWRLIVSDDGSDAAARDLLADFATTGHDVAVFDGPRRGAGANFHSLLLRARELGAQGYLAFSDQDDVWLPEKLERAVAALDGQGGPALYCSRTFVTRADLSDPRPSAPRPRPLGFRNALVQNVAAGNTIVLNPASAALVVEAAAESEAIHKHDWWIYQLLSGIGATLIHDDRPSLYYRQHAGNAEGANLSLGAKLDRLRRLRRGEWRDWTGRALAALEPARHRMTPENRALLDAFVAMRDAPLPGRLTQFARLRLYRQSRAGTVALWIATLFRLI